MAPPTEPDLSRPPDVPDVPLEEHLAAAAEQDLREADAPAIERALAAMVGHPQYPCLGARSVFNSGTVEIVVLGDMRDPGSVVALADRLLACAARSDPDGPFVSLVATFRAPIPQTEEEFERSLWTVLQRLADIDDRPWAEGVSDDPGKPTFAFSFGGTAYFVVGLHPHASRIARRAPLPTMVFNLHAQFERLRAEGGFERMRDTIRRRDTALQGDTNPMAQDHGAASEAQQYSGREVEPDWRPPFSPKGAR